jgi:hypothetical protein
MQIEKNEEALPVVNEVYEAIVPEILHDVPVDETTVKVKKPRSEKQQMALKAMLKKRQEMAVVQRADRKERRAPKWYKELNAQQKELSEQEREIQEMRQIIDMMREQMIDDKGSSPVQEDEEELEAPVHDPFGRGDGIYYHPPPIVKQTVFKDTRPVRKFGPNDKLSLLRHLL